MTTRRLEHVGVGPDSAQGLLNLIVDPTVQGVQQPVVRNAFALGDPRALRFHLLSDIDEHPACVAYGPERGDLRVDLLSREGS